MNRCEGRRAFFRIAYGVTTFLTKLHSSCVCGQDGCVRGVRVGVRGVQAGELRVSAGHTITIQLDNVVY